jgi:WD40 repeat protein
MSARSRIRLAQVVLGSVALAVASCGGDGKQSAGGGGSGGGGGGGGAGGGSGGAGGSSAWGGATKTVAMAPNLEAPCGWHGIGHASDLAFSPDGSLLVAAGGGYLKAFDAATGRHVFASPWHPADLFSVAFSPNGAWVATSAPTGGPAYFKGAAAVWRVASPTQGAMLLLGYDVGAIGFSSDSAMLAVAIRSPVARVAVFELGGLSMVASVNQTDFATGGMMSISADGRQLVYQGSTTFTAGGAQWFGALIPPSGVSTDPPVPNWSAYAPASNVAVGIGGTQTPVINANYNGGTPVSGGQIMSPDGVDFSAVALSHAGWTLAAGETNGHVYVWQLPHALPVTGAPALSLTTQVGTVPALAFSPDDSLLATASDDGTLYVRRVSDGSEVWHAEGPPPFQNGVSVLAANATSGLVLALADRGYVLDPAKDAIRGTLGRGTGSSPDGTTCVGSADALAMACPGDQITFQAMGGAAVLTGSPAGTGSFTVRGGFALAPDHGLLVESIDNQMNLPASHAADLWSWPLPAGSPGGKLAHPDRLLQRLAWSGDGSTLAGVRASPNDAPVWAWDAASGAALGQWGLTANLDETTFFGEVAISDAGDVIAAVDKDNPDVALVRPRAGTVQRLAPTTDDGNSGFSAVSVSPDGTRVAVTSEYRAGAPTGVVTHSVTVFGSDGTPVSRIAGYLHLNTFPTAFLDGRTLLRGEQDGSVSVW